MAEKKEYIEFRSLLRQAMGGMTQKAFADASGLSVEHLNRLLNSDVISRPSKSTLKKIVDVGADINPFDLYESCGYEKIDCRVGVRVSQHKMSFEENLKQNAKNLHDSFCFMIRDANMFPSINYMITRYMSRYALDLRKIFYDDNRMIANHTQHKGDWALPCKAVWHVEKSARQHYEVHTYFAVFGVNLVNGSVMVTDIAVDAATLNDLGFIPQPYIDELYADGTNINDLPYFAVNQLKTNPLSVERRLLNSIFGIQDDEDEPECMHLFSVKYGRGSIYEKTPEGFAEYIYKNQKYFDADEVEAELFEELKCKYALPAESMDKVFAEYSFMGASGTAGAVLAVMTRKFKDAGYEFEVSYDESEEYADILKPCIYVHEDYYCNGVTLDRDKLALVDEKLKEEFMVLKMPTYGDTITYTSTSVNYKDLSGSQKPLVPEENVSDSDE